MTFSGPPHDDSTPHRVEDVWAQLQSEAAERGFISPEEIRRRFPDIADELIDVLEMDRRMHAASPMLLERAAQGDAADDDLTLIRSALPSFEILAEIGRGGQGVVFKAIQPSTDRVVALKILYAFSGTDPHRRQRFAREIEIVSGLRHPNIVALFESGTVLGRPFYAMEFIEGLPIDEYVTCVHRPSVDARVRTFIKVCRAVANAHQRGVIHRDLKPRNILVDLDDEPYILDFGLAKDLDGRHEHTTEAAVSVTGFAFGTLPFSSPEQATGRMNEVDTRSDIYSLGVILFKLLTGAMPYPVSGSREEVAARIANDAPQSFRRALSEAEIQQYPPGTLLPDDLEQIARKAMAKEPGRRYQSAAAFAEDLDRFLAGQAVSAKADSAFYVLAKAMRRYKVHVSVAAAFVVLVLGALVGMTALWRESERHALMYQKGLEAGAFVRLGRVERDEGRSLKAIEMLNQAIAISKSIGEPSDELLQFRCNALLSLSSMSLRVEDVEDARRYVSEAEAVVREASARFPNSIRWKLHKSSRHLTLGRVLLAEKEFGKALAEFKESLAIRDELLKLEPDNEGFIDDVASVYRYIAQSHRRMGNSDLALPYYERAYQLQLALNESHPESPERIVDVCHAENSLAAWHISQNTEEHDRIAKEYLKATEARLAKLESMGRAQSVAIERSELAYTLEHNLGLLARRNERRRASHDGQPGHSEPSSPDSSGSSSPSSSATDEPTN